MLTFVLFVLILTILVFVHEFGHFITARKLGMRVYEFAIGFPPFAIGCYRDPKTGKLGFVDSNLGYRFFHRLWRLNCNEFGY